jgi:uncharacterized protein involved in cysteine biosynthesis
LLFVPWLYGILSFSSGFAWFVNHDDSLLAWFVTRPIQGAGFISWLGYYVFKVLIYLSALIFTATLATLVMSIASSPIYEVISGAIDREELGHAAPSLGWAAALRVAIAEVKKVFLILMVSFVFLVIPGVNLLATVAAAFLLGWDVFDYPLARRGWTLKQRRQLVLREFWAVLGLGLWMVIPFGQILTIPLAIAGGTRLSLDALKRHPRLDG